MKNIEKTDKMSLARLIDELRYGKFTIPDFQREFEWKPWNVVELLQSIFEDYYIGTLLFWRASKENLALLSCEPISGFRGRNKDPEHIVLDGQQRLSALYYAFFAPDKEYPGRKTRFLFMMNIERLLKDKDNLEDAFEYERSKRNQNLLTDRERQFREKRFPLSVLGETNYAWVEWLNEYEKFWLPTAGSSVRREKKELYEILDSLLQTYDISYIELDRRLDVSKVCDIFKRLNDTGMKLTIFDLLNALLRPKGIKLKEMWQAVADELNGDEIERMKIYLLQVMSILRQAYCAPKYLYYLVPGAQKVIKNPDGTREKTVLIRSSNEFHALWNDVVLKVKETLIALQSPRDFGAIKPKFIPYPSMIPVLTAINTERDTGDYADKQDIEGKVKRWYWSSIFTQSYSSAAESKMARDFLELKRWFKDDTDAPIVVTQCESEIDHLDIVDETKPNAAIYKAIFNILVTNGARDWANFKLPEYSKLEDHHIVPRSWGRKKGLGDKIDTIVNRTPLSDDTNKKVIKDKLPNVYLKEMFGKAKNREAVYKLLETHLISRKAVDILLREDFSVADYKEFIAERQKAIMGEVHSLLGLGAKPLTTLISPETPFSNKLQIERVVRSCDRYLYWVDKYFSRYGLEVIRDALADHPTKLTKIRILMAVEKVDLAFKKAASEFRKEFRHKGINTEFRAICDNKIKAQIHDRWIITEGRTYNIPSPDTVARGQYSEIKETQAKPPFKEWWQEGVNIIERWDKVARFVKRDL